MDHFFTSLTQGLFGQTNDEEQPGSCASYSEIKGNEDNHPKRMRRNTSGSRTPTLVSAGPDRIEDTRPAKRRRGEKGTSLGIVAKEESKKESEKGLELTSLPEDLVAQCLSFLGGVEDRHSLQCTSRQFRRISNSDEMMIGIQVGGNKETGLNGIITEKDTPETAAANLDPFAIAGNLEAIYMLGIIKSYCNQDVECGISLLKAASSQGYVRASYALGLVLRDSHPKEAADYMTNAADAGYIPALQEVLPPRQMKAQYGEPKADELRRHLDPLCLNRLLSRHYVKSAELRPLSTSHCWNPLCGRWAFKAVTSTILPGRSLRQRRHAAHAAHWRAAAHGVRQPDEEEDVVVLDPSSLETSAVDPGGSPINNATLAQEAPAGTPQSLDIRVSRMKMCSRCCRAKYCSKLCQVYDWRSGRHKMECQYL